MTPFANYTDFEDCVSKNKDKSNPEAYCASIHKKSTGKWPSEKESFDSEIDYICLNIPVLIRLFEFFLETKKTSDVDLHIIVEKIIERSKQTKILTMKDYDYVIGNIASPMKEAMYQGKSVTLDKPFRTPNESKKFAVYTTHPQTGNVVIVRFGDPDMEIKRDDDESRNSFRARHQCENKTYAKDRHTPGYWSCKMWEKNKSVSDITSEKMDIQKEITILEEAYTLLKERKYVTDNDEFKSMKPVNGNGPTNKFNGCVRDMMSKGHDRQSAENICGYIKSRKGESINKDENPIEQNPKNIRNVGTTLKMDNVPMDKEPSDECEYEGGQYRKTKKEILDDISYLERRIYIDDPFSAPPGVNLQVGNRGGYYYDSDSATAAPDEKPSDTKKKKDDKNKQEINLATPK